MTSAEAMKRLEGAGNEMCRTTWLRHGVRPPLFGVRYADLYKLQKEIGVDQGLASTLWKTGNHDARILATLVADPAGISARELDVWLTDSPNRILSDAVSGVAGRSPLAAKKADAWRKAREEWRSSAGWSVAARLGALDSGVTDERLDGLLDEIRAGIASAPNFTRHAMNGALIAIGGSRPALRSKALAVAKAIGKVDVDHGDTSCQTPDAASYIAKLVARQAAKGSAKSKGSSRSKAPAKRKPPAAPRAAR